MQVKGKFSALQGAAILLFLVGAITGACTPKQNSPLATPSIATQTNSPVKTAITFPTASPTPEKSDYTGFFDKPEVPSIRVVSYNINWDSIFPVGDPQSHDLRSFSKARAFARVIGALQPDILCLQEINPARDAQEINDMLDAILEIESEDGWQSTIMRDNVISSHFDLLTEGYQMQTNTFRPNMEQAAALIDLPNEIYGELDIYLVCAHFKASGSVADILQRQKQADIVMSNIADLRSPGGHMDAEFGTPFVILGDFNVYTSDPARHLATLLTGDVDDDERYGPDSPPDWDGSELVDALPSHNALGEQFYTWRDDQAVFKTGVLDHIIYSDSVLRVENAFILNTMLLSEEGLELYGLMEYDVLLNPMTGYYDHLPLVVDFSIIHLPEN